MSTVAELDIEARAAILDGVEALACDGCKRPVPATAAADPAWVIRTMPVIRLTSAFIAATATCPACAVPAGKRPPDATCASHGSIWVLAPITPEAEQWMDENIHPDAAWVGGALAIEARYGGDVIAAMRSAGLSVEVPRC